MADDNTYLTPEEASDFLERRGLPVAASTLRKLRCVGGGPKFVKFGRFPRYTAPWLLEFAQGKLSQPMRSTSDNAPKQEAERRRRKPSAQPRR